jgi:hypothetical protein
MSSRLQQEIGLALIYCGALLSCAGLVLRALS